MQCTCLRQASPLPIVYWARTAFAHAFSASFPIASRACINLACAASLGFSFRLAMAAPQSAQEALRAWLNFLSPEQRRAAESQMGAALSASATASDEHIKVDSPAEPAVSSGQADPSTTPIPEEPNPRGGPSGNGTTAKTNYFKALSHQRPPGRTMIYQPSLPRQPLLSLWEARTGPRRRPQTKSRGYCPNLTHAYLTYLESPSNFSTSRRASPRAKCPNAYCIRTSQQPMNSLLIVRKCGRPHSTSPFSEQPADGPILICCQKISAGLRLNFAMKLRTRPSSLQQLELSPKKRHDPSKCLLRAAPIYRPNCLRKTRGQMSQKKRHPHSLPHPPRPSQPRCPRHLLRPSYNRAEA